MKLKDYLHMIKRLGWTLEKGSIDHKLYDKTGKYLTQIKIVHPPGNLVHADSVKKTEKLMKEAGH
jgi:hypothetical protein